MDVSVLVFKNHQSEDMEGYDLQELVYPIYHHSQEMFLQGVLTNYLF